MSPTVPYTGSARNGAAFLSALGESIALPDGSAIKAIVELDNRDSQDEHDSTNREYFWLWFPNNAMGTLAVDQTITMRGAQYFVNHIKKDREPLDGWSYAQIAPV